MTVYDILRAVGKITQAEAAAIVPRTAPTLPCSERKAPRVAEAAPPSINTAKCPTSPTFSSTSEHQD